MLACLLPSSPLYSFIATVYSLIPLFAPVKTWWTNGTRRGAVRLEKVLRGTRRYPASRIWNLTGFVLLAALELWVSWNRDMSLIF